METKELRNVLIIIGFVLLITVPFINQAYHIDDTTSIFVAKQMVKKPLRMYDGDMIYFGKKVSLINTTKGPVIAGIIAMILYLTGSFPEYLVHLSLIVFPLIGAISIYYLFKRFVKYPLQATLLLVSIPVFVVMSQHAMPDMAMFSLAMASLTLYIYASDNDNNLLLILSGISGGIAILAKYPALVIIPLILLYAVLYKKNMLKSLIPVGISLFVLGIWCVHNYLIYGQLHLISTGSKVATSLIKIVGLRGVGLITSLGGATVFFLAMIYLYAKNHEDRITSYWMAAFALLSTLVVFALGYNFLHSFMFFLFFFTGLLVVYKGLFIDKLWHFFPKRRIISLSSYVLCFLILVVGFFVEVFLLFKRKAILDGAVTLITNLYELSTGFIILARPLDYWLNLILPSYNNLIIALPLITLLSSTLFFLAGSHLRQKARPRPLPTIKFIYEHNQDVFFFCWFLGSMVYVTFFVLFGGPFRILFSLPPVVYVFVRQISELRKREIRFILPLTILLTLALSLSVSFANYQFSDVYRDFAGRAESYGDDLWFVGHMGFQHYMLESGYNELASSNDDLKSGDIIFRPLTPSPQPFHPELKKRIDMVDTIVYNSSFPLRVINLEAHASMYSSAWGFLPWSFSNAPLENIEVYRVN